METRKFKGTNSDVSLLGLGCMRLPKVDPEKPNIDFEKAQEIVDYAYSHGINYYDTAYMYHEGESENFIGQALKKYPRESFNLTTKLPIWFAKSKEDVEKIFNEQLEKCQVDYFDFYLMHAMNKERLPLYKEWAYDFLLKMKAEGKIKHLGFSFHDKPEVLDKACQTFPEAEVVQIQLNYLDWEMQDAKQQYEIIERYGKQCIIMEPVRGGALANPCEAANKLFKDAAPDKSIASWAIRYAASLPNVLVVLSGMSNLEQIVDNVNTISNFKPLTNEEYEIINKAVEAYKLKDTVPCTGCRYCMDCPFGVDIPKVFSIYNKYAVSKDKEAYKKAYEALADSEKADKCRACGACMKKCPQHIQIPDKMKMIKELNEKLFK